MKELQRKLNGNSGCHLQAFKTDDNLILIRKTSRDFDYNDRLKAQMLKQKAFSVYSSGLCSPYVKNFGMENNLFYFDMNFINGQNMAQYIINTDFSAMGLLVNKLFNDISVFSKTESIKIDTKLVFSLKIKELNREINSEWEFIKKAFFMLEQFDWSKIPQSYCHGDLTLENILISNDGDIYLIDFLDSFYNSWMFDMSKIFQDIELGWAYRNQKPCANRSVKLNLVKEKILEKLYKFNNGENIIFSIYHLLLLNLLRIYPYTKDCSGILFLNKSLEKVIKIISEMKKENYDYVNNTLCGAFN